VPKQSVVSRSTDFDLIQNPRLQNLIWLPLIPSTLLATLTSKNWSTPSTKLLEIKSRYDLKDTQTTMELGEQAITVNTDSEFNLDAVHIQTKAAKRDLSLKIFDYGKVDSASGNRVRQEIKLKKGISQEIASKSLS